MGFSNFCLFPGNFSKLRTVKLFSCEVFLSMKIIEGKNGNSFDGGHPPQHSVKDQTISIFSYEGFLKFLSFCWRLIVKVKESDNHIRFCWFCTSIGVLTIRLNKLNTIKVILLIWFHLIFYTLYKIFFIFESNKNL